MFPVTRLRRLRRSQQIRDLLSETSIDTGKMMMPVFVDETTDRSVEVSSMPGGVRRYSLGGLLGDYLRSWRKRGG